MWPLPHPKIKTKKWKSAKAWNRTSLSPAPPNTHTNISLAAKGNFRIGRRFLFTAHRVCAENRGRWRGSFCKTFCSVILLSKVHGLLSLKIWKIPKPTSMQGIEKIHLDDAYEDSPQVHFTHSSKTNQQKNRWEISGFWVLCLADHTVSFWQVDVCTWIDLTISYTCVSDQQPLPVFFLFIPLRFQLWLVVGFARWISKH